MTCSLRSWQHCFRTECAHQQTDAILGANRPTSSDVESRIMGLPPINPNHRRSNQADTRTDDRKGARHKPKCLRATEQPIVLVKLRVNEAKQPATATPDPAPISTPFA